MDNIIIIDFGTSLSTVDRTSRHKISKEILHLNYTLNQINLRDIYGGSTQSNRMLILLKHTFFSSIHERFSRIDRMYGHQTHLKFKMVDILSSTLSDHNGIKVEIN